MNKVLVEILGLSSSPSAGGAYALLLKETYGSRRLPIIIGAFEAQAITLEIEGIKPPRPLTHDLLKSFIDNLGATVNEVIISELKENTFFAKISIEVSTLVNDIDARPSDAIALAVRTGAPIYVSEEVMKYASFIPSSEDSEGNLEDVFGSSETKDEPEENEKPKGISADESKVASLHEQLRQAIEKEDYERAAKLRDEISKREGNNN
ncbi:MAG: bifunctional nuclease family protein [Bacteroidetes bacterium]|nr:bifunctional nuclease family protein [Bacteroidota bacterium]